MLKKIIAIGATIIIIAGGIIAYAFLRTPEEASTAIAAIPVVVNTPPAVPSEPIAEPVVETAAETEVAAEVLATEPDSDEPVAQLSDTPAETDETATTNEAAVTKDETTVAEAEEAAAPAAASEALASRPTIFEIIPAESQVRFLIGEVLNGSPITVVGATDQVAGQFAIDASDLSTTQMGPILINARTLVTNNNFRNRALKNRILLTDQFEFITFTPTAITGLNGAGSAGESYAFQISGDLTIREVTRPVTFETSVSAVSDNQLQGSATTTILYKDFELAIPSVPSVASVEDEVILEIDFVATASENS